MDWTATELLRIQALQTTPTTLRKLSTSQEPRHMALRYRHPSTDFSFLSKYMQ